MSSDHSRRILLLMSGSIACAKATSLISHWVKSRHRVRVACSRSALQFVGRATLEGLGAERVFEDLFGNGQAMDHVHLARWADLVIACPATSNFINKLSAGIADDTVSTLWQVAHDTGRPMLIVPAMNTRMWQYPATQHSVNTLRSWGSHVMEPDSGLLACGEDGAGRMPDIADVASRVETLMTDDGTGSRVLVTGGGTREPIDSVRYIGNTSTGRTAASLADALTRFGHEVWWLGAREALAPTLVQHSRYFDTFEDLDQQLLTLLQAESFGVVVHAAAVSDYHVARLDQDQAVPGPASKLPSGSDLTLHLKPNPKLLGKIRKYSRGGKIRIVGFKLTHTQDQQTRNAAVRSVLDGGADVVVHNDVSEITAQQHPYSWHDGQSDAVALADHHALARQLNQWLRETP